MAKRKQYREITGTEDEIISITEIVRTLKTSSKYFKELRINQKVFVAHYCTNGHDAKKAALMAGYKAAYASSSGGKLLADIKVKRAIKEFTEIYMGRLKDIIKVKTIETLKLRAFYKIGDILNSTGGLKVKDLEDLGELQVCVESIETKIINGIEQRTIKLANRERSLEALAKYTDILNNDIIDVNINTGVLLVNSLKTNAEWKAMTKGK